MNKYAYPLFRLRLRPLKNNRRLLLMRKFKQVKRKEIIFDLAEWNEVKRRAEQISMTTSEYIRRMAVNGKISRFKISDITPVINALRIIGGNINQVAKKSNEINSIYAEDIKILQNKMEDLCHTLSQNLFALQ